MDKLQFSFKDGSKVYADQLNSIVSKVNSLIDFRNRFGDDISEGSLDINNAKYVGFNNEYTFFGEPVIPNFKVIMLGKVLEAGVDYAYDLYNNTKIGEGTMVFYGLGNWTGTVEKKFNIVGNAYKLTYNTGVVRVDKPTIKISALTDTVLAELVDSTNDYSFDGWYYDDGTFTNPVQVGDILEEDTTIYAKWIRNTFTLTLDWGDSFDSTTDVTTMRVSELPELTLGKHGNEFILGWYYGDGRQANTGDRLSDDVTITVKLLNKDLSMEYTRQYIYLRYDNETDGLVAEYSTDNTTWDIYYGNGIDAESGKTYYARLKYNEEIVTKSANTPIVVVNSYEDSVLLQSADNGNISIENDDIGINGCEIEDISKVNGSLTIKDGGKTGYLTISNE